MQDTTATATSAEPAVVTLTPGAVERVRALLAADPEGAGKGLRVFIEPGGCSGMQYAMQFDSPRDGDVVTEFDGVSLLVDRVSADYLRGAVVDFKDELTGGGFKISNPNARQSCGCGKSFET